MSKYFDGYASFYYNEMSKEKLITELKEKVRYIGELKRNNDKEIAKVQSIKDKTIADLEAKLAESEEQINKLQTFNKSLNSIKEDMCKRLDLIRTSSKKDYIRNMEQQLAEKDDELLQKEKRIQDLMLCEFVATTLDFNKLSADNCKLREQLVEHNQDKISFALEQLEKVKEIALKDFDLDKSNLSLARVLDKIDNQIKQLKEMK